MRKTNNTTINDTIANITVQPTQFVASNNNDFMIIINSVVSGIQGFANTNKYTSFLVLAFGVGICCIVFGKISSAIGKIIVILVILAIIFYLATGVALW